MNLSDCKCLLETSLSFLCKTIVVVSSEDTWSCQMYSMVIQIELPYDHAIPCTWRANLHVLKIISRSRTLFLAWSVIHQTPNNMLQHVCVHCAVVPKVLCSLAAHEAANLEVIHLSTMLMFKIPPIRIKRIRCMQSCSTETTLQCHLRLCIGTHHPYRGYNHQSGRQDFANGNQEVLGMLDEAKNFWKAFCMSRSVGIALLTLPSSRHTWTVPNKWT